MIISIDKEYIFGKKCRKYVHRSKGDKSVYEKTMWVYFDSSKKPKPIPLRYEVKATDHETSFVTKHFQIDYNSYDSVKSIKNSVSLLQKVISMIIDRSQ